MKYSLRSLMIVVLVLPPLLATGWWGVLSAIVPVERADIDFGESGDLKKAIAAYEKYLENHPPAPKPLP